MIKLVKRINQLFGDMLIPVGSQGGYTTVQDIVDLASSGSSSSGPKVISMTLTDGMAGNPGVQILQNDFEGTPTVVRDGDGSFSVNLANSFGADAAKVAVYFGRAMNTNYYYGYWESASIIRLEVSADGMIVTGGWDNNTPVRIEVLV